MKYPQLIEKWWKGKLNRSQQVLFMSVALAIMVIIAGVGVYSLAFGVLLLVMFILIARHFILFWIYRKKATR